MHTSPLSIGISDQRWAFIKSVIGDVHYLSAISLQAVYVSAENCGFPDNIHLKVAITRIDWMVISYGMEKAEARLSFILASCNL